MDLTVADDGPLFLRVDHAVTLATGDDYWILIEQTFSFTDPHGTRHLIDPEDPGQLGPVLPLARTGLIAAAAFDDGRLALDFADGSVIAVPPGGEYEVWQLTGPAGLLVSLPGGDLSVWSGHTG